MQSTRSRIQRIALLAFAACTACGVFAACGPAPPPAAAHRNVAVETSTTAGASLPFGTDTNRAAAGARECDIGQITLTAGKHTMGVPASGQVLPVAQYPALFDQIGNRFGGDGKSTFALPDLRAVAPDNTTYGICVNGLWPSDRDFGQLPPAPLPKEKPDPATLFGDAPGWTFPGHSLNECQLGQLNLMSGSVGYGIPADGRKLDIRSFRELYYELGTRFGGDGKTTIAVPDLRKAAPNGTTYSICVRGDPALDVTYPGARDVPPAKTGQALTDLLGKKTGTAKPAQGTECTMSELKLTAGRSAGGNMPALGQTVPLKSQWYALYALLGTRYGGDGKANFVLPDLRAAAPNGLTYSICVDGTFPSRD